MLIPRHDWCFIYLAPEICCRIRAAVTLKGIAQLNPEELWVFLRIWATSSNYVIWHEPSPWWQRSWGASCQGSDAVPIPRGVKTSRGKALSSQVWPQSWPCLRQRGGLETSTNPVWTIPWSYSITVYCPFQDKFFKIILVGFFIAPTYASVPEATPLPAPFDACRCGTEKVKCDFFHSYYHINKSKNMLIRLCSFLLHSLVCYQNTDIVFCAFCSADNGNRLLWKSLVRNFSLPVVGWWQAQPQTHSKLLAKLSDEEAASHHFSSADQSHSLATWKDCI